MGRPVERSLQLHRPGHRSRGPSLGGHHARPESQGRQLRQVPRHAVRTAGAAEVLRRGGFRHHPAERPAAGLYPDAGDLLALRDRLRSGAGARRVPRRPGHPANPGDHRELARAGHAGGGRGQGPLRPAADRPRAGPAGLHLDPAAVRLVYRHRGNVVPGAAAAGYRPAFRRHVEVPGHGRLGRRGVGRRLGRRTPANVRRAEQHPPALRPRQAERRAVGEAGQPGDQVRGDLLRAVLRQGRLYPRHRARRRSAGSRARSPSGRS